MWNVLIDKHNYCNMYNYTSGMLVIMVPLAKRQYWNM